MANSNLTKAKNEKNDEFYTQYADIQKEIGAYLMYNKDTFRTKVVYCNCDDPYESNFFKYFVLNFERLGLKKLITTSYKPSTVANTQIGLFGDDKTIAPHKGRPKITANKFIITEVGDYDDDGQFNLEDVSRQLKENKNNEWAPLEGDGDFRSDECIELLKQSDIVVTNPPFSLYREYVGQLVEYKKSFLIIGNMGSIIYKEIFPLVKENKLWFGATGSGKDKVFAVPPEFNVDPKDKQKAARLGYIGDYTRLGNSSWFTNLDHGRRHEQLKLMTTKDNFKFNKKMKDKVAYDNYDNYDAIEVPFTDAIPSDYDGLMGVPISFLDKYSPEQFEIIWQTSGNTRASAPNAILEKIKYRRHSEDRGGCGIVKGKRVYSRILIRHRKAIL